MAFSDLGGGQPRAAKVAEIRDRVAAGSVMGLARVLIGLAPEDKNPVMGSEERRRLMDEKRQLHRWLDVKNTAPLRRSSALRVVREANRVLRDRGELLFPDDYLVEESLDPWEEISRKLDLLLAHFAIEAPPAPVSEVDEALGRLERPGGGVGRSGRAGRRSRGGEP